jgi:uncharacterized protein YjbI with pentapeptide repeats
VSRLRPDRQPASAGQYRPSRPQYRRRRMPPPLGPSRPTAPSAATSGRFSPGNLATLLTALAAVAAVFFTGLQVMAIRRQAEIAQQQAELAANSQITSEYTQAVTQLGSSSQDVRLGGIYALERLAHESPTNQPAIIEMLSAYVRSHTLRAFDPSCVPPSGSPLPPLPSDLAATITVLARRDRTHDENTQPDFSSSCLIYDFTGVGLDWRGANLSQVKLTGANLPPIRLDGADLQGVNLDGAYAFAVSLTKAILYDVSCVGASLLASDFTGALVEGATFKNADLTETNFTDANLGGTDFTGANVEMAYFTHTKDADLTGSIGTPTAGP